MVEVLKIKSRFGFFAQPETILSKTYSNLLVNFIVFLETTLIIIINSTIIELIMGRKDRKRLSAILDGGTNSDPVKKVKKSSTEGPMKKKESSPKIKNESDAKKLTAEEVLKDSKQDDFLEYLKEENPEMLEELEGGDLGELSASSDEEDEYEPKLDGEDSFDEDGFDFEEFDDDEGGYEVDPEDDEVEMVRCILFYA